MNDIITFLLSNFTLTLLALWLIFSAIHLLAIRNPRRHHNKNLDIFTGYFFFFVIGISGLYGFIGHVFFGDYVAAFIGWRQSPFQLEVGFANLAFGVLGVLCFRASMGFRLATLIGTVCFLWGAAIGHTYQMVVYQNFESGNAGIIYWTDIIIPIVGIILLSSLHLQNKK